MPVIFHRKFFWVIMLLAAAMIFITCTFNRRKIDFSADVKPIINKKCISCHGGVKKQGGFSLLFRDEALDTTESGRPAIIPGHPEESEMIRRLTLTDPEERMPYDHEPLSKGEIDILSTWIKQGAEWGEHWAYVPVKAVAIPEVTHKNIKNNIDRFIIAKLEQEKMQPSPEADKATLLRRLSLDLTGMPAPASIARQYLSDNSDKAYENLVDSLLASPHFGERWTAMWLDLARYADTKGYERDDNRSIWRYRDWLIKAFNEDKPYNQFITEQIAGDLLPNPTDMQYIATAFHRNSLTNDEGGTDNEEFRTAAVMDRVNTTWEALMGTTFSCVQCHSHPYDPFKHDEYYNFLAYFNNTRDEDTYADYPLLREYKANDSLKFEKLRTWLRSNTSEQEQQSIVHFVKTIDPAYNSLKADSFVNCELNDTKWLNMRNHSVARLSAVNLSQRDQLLFRYISWIPDGVLELHADQRDGPLLCKVKLPQTRGWQLLQLPTQPMNGKHDIWFTYSGQSLAKDAGGLQFDWLHFSSPFPGKEKPWGDSAYAYYLDLLNTGNVTTTPVMMDNVAYMQRQTNVFERGNWLVKGKAVTPSVPQSLQAAMPANAPANRLGMAMWMVDKKNPLLSRTMVNRLWEQLFGTGIVETLEDLGTQGMMPTHRELLDHLAYEFMNTQHWSVKQLLKTMVMSGTYRQDSKITEEAKEKDLFNKLYVRGPRVRLSAEQVRDQALCVSNILYGKMYGPSVFPYQPKGIWLSPWNGQDWIISEGDERYRRAVYTYWKRSSPYPSMITFDGAAREVCTARRIRTNTPLQALVTLNDPAYLDLAKHFAERMKKEAGNDVKRQIAKGYELMLYKPLAPEKLKVLESLYQTAFTSYKTAADTTLGSSPEDAALAVVANALFNLDEAVTKN